MIIKMVFVFSSYSIIQGYSHHIKSMILCVKVGEQCQDRRLFLIFHRLKQKAEDKQFLDSNQELVLICHGYNYVLKIRLFVTFIKAAISLLCLILYLVHKSCISQGLDCSVSHCNSVAATDQMSAKIVGLSCPSNTSGACQGFVIIEGYACSRK